MFQPAGIDSPVRVVSMSEYVDICQTTPLTNQCCGMKRWRETKPATPDSQNPEDFSDLGRCMRPRFVGRLDFSPDKEECETTGPSTSMDLAEVQGLGFFYELSIKKISACLLLYKFVQISGCVPDSNEGSRRQKGYCNMRALFDERSALDKNVYSLQSSDLCWMCKALRRMQERLLCVLHHYQVRILVRNEFLLESNFDLKSYTRRFDHTICLTCEDQLR